MESEGASRRKHENVLASRSWTSSQRASHVPRRTSSAAPSCPVRGKQESTDTTAVTRQARSNRNAYRRTGPGHCRSLLHPTPPPAAREHSGTHRSRGNWPAERLWDGRPQHWIKRESSAGRTWRQSQIGMWKGARRGVPKEHRVDSCAYLQPLSSFTQSQSFLHLSSARHVALQFLVRCTTRTSLSMPFPPVSQFYKPFIHGMKQCQWHDAMDSMKASGKKSGMGPAPMGKEGVSLHGTTPAVAPHA